MQHNYGWLPLLTSNEESKGKNILLNDNTSQADDNMKYSITSSTTRAIAEQIPWKHNKEMWVPDDKVNNCFNCNCKFSALFQWKHHCRICGNIFCQDCSKNVIKIIKNNIINELRVCAKCNKMHDKYGKIMKKQLTTYTNNSTSNNVNNSSINVKLETKFSNYCKTWKSKQNNTLHFLKSDKHWENKIKNKINSVYESLVKTLIHNVLKDNLSDASIQNTNNTNTFNNTSEWENILYTLTWETIGNINPSFSALNDSLDINTYLKIKTIPYPNKTKCRVIDGYAMHKNLCFKKMKTNIVKPSIWLIDDSLDSNNIITPYNDPYLQIIKGKINMWSPDVIIVRNSISQNLLNDFINDSSFKYNIIMNVKKRTMKRLSRACKGLVIPSVDLIDKNTIWGYCDEFKVESFKIIESAKEQDIIKSKEYNLMIFEGCDKVWFNTIILSGPNIRELKDIKKIWKEIILPTARDWCLQKSYIYYFNMQVPEANGMSEKNHLFFRSTINECDNDHVNTIINKNNGKKNKEISTYYQGFDTALTLPYSTDTEKVESVNSSNISFDIATHMKNEMIVIKATMYIPYIPSSKHENLIFKSWTHSSSFSQIDIESKLESTSSTHTNVNESDIHKTLIAICENSARISWRFYSNDNTYDKPLGQFIIDLCSQTGTVCKNCHKPGENHIYYMYKNNKQIKISTILGPNEDDHGRVIKYIAKLTGEKYHKYQYEFSTAPSQWKCNYKNDIYTYGYCRVCQSIVTPLFKWNNNMMNYSSSKFWKDLYDNHNTKNLSQRVNFNISSWRNKTNCKHFINKDIYRIFITKYGSFKFEFNKISKYFIMPMNLNSIISASFSRDKLLEFYLSNARVISSKLVSLIKQVLLTKKGNILTIKADPKMNAFTSVCELLLNSIEIFEMKIDFIRVKIIDVILSKKQNYFASYVEAIVFIKEIYLQIIKCNLMINTIDIIVNKILFSCDMTGLNQSMNKVNISNDTDDVDINKDDAYLNLLSFVNYYDDSHSMYSCEVKEDDLASIIAYAWSSDNYINYCEMTKLKLNQVQCERKSQDVVKDIILENVIKRKSSQNILAFKSGGIMGSDEKRGSNNNINGDVAMNISLNNMDTEEVWFDTWLWFDQSKQKFTFGNYDNEKVLQMWETELLNNEKNKFTFHVQHDIGKFILGNYSNSNENKEDLCSRNRGMLKKQGLNTIGLKPCKVTITNDNPQIIKTTNIAQSDFNNNNNNININHITQCQTKIEWWDIINSFSKDIQHLRDTVNTIKNMSASINQSHDQNSYNSSNPMNTSASDIEDSRIFSHSFPEFDVIVYYALQFAALRISYCSTFNEIIISWSKSKEWSDNTGGKSKAGFYKSIDEKYIFKLVSKTEFKMFISSAEQYFNHTAKYLFHKMPSAIAKILGAYKIKKKRNDNNRNRIDKFYIILMENLFYGMDHQPNIKAYDLKGSKNNRYVPKGKRKKNQVLQDTNFQEDFKGEPLVIDKNVYDMLIAGLHNDSWIFNKINVVDYSLLLIIDESDTEKGMKLIKLGIIDYIRKYTWDKQWEHVGKKLINKFSTPTITNPEHYKQRFLREIERYFIGI